MTRKNFRDIVLVNTQVLSGYKAQKAHTMSILDKYMNRVQEEADIGQNKFLPWTRHVDPLISSMKSQQLVEDLITKQYETYIKELAGEIAKNQWSEEYTQTLIGNIDKVLASLFRLENKYANQVNHTKAQTKRMIKTYQLLPENFKQKLKGFCVYCGVELLPNLGDTAKECRFCLNISKPIKDELVKDGLNASKLSDGEIRKKVSESIMREDFDFFDIPKNKYRGGKSAAVAPKQEQTGEKDNSESD